MSLEQVRGPVHLAPLPTTPVLHLVPPLQPLLKLTLFLPAWCLPPTHTPTHTVPEQNHPLLATHLIPLFQPLLELFLFQPIFLTRLHLAPLRRRCLILCMGEQMGGVCVGGWGGVR